MGARNTVNRVLRKGAGIEFVKSGTLNRLKGDVAQAKKRASAADAKVKQTQEQVKAARDQLRAEKSEHEKLLAYVTREVWDLPPDYHPDMRWIWPEVKDRTTAGHEKLNCFLDAVRYVEKTGIEGDIVECGVWRGGAMLGCVLTLDRLGSRERDLYLYDTYEGAEPGGLEDVRSAFDETDYPPERLHFVQGKVEDTIPETMPERIAVLRLATSWYESTRHELEHLYPRLAPGGIVIIDDYGTWKGSRDAVEEYFAEHPDGLFLVRAGRGRAGVKPWSSAD